jgi:hypothetical protein
VKPLRSMGGAEPFRGMGGRWREQPFRSMGAMTGVPNSEYEGAGLCRHFEVWRVQLFRNIERSAWCSNFGVCRTDHPTALYPQKLVLTSPTSHYGV